MKLELPAGPPARAAGKCKLYLKGMPIEEARSLVRDTMSANQRLHVLSDMLKCSCAVIRRAWMSVCLLARSIVSLHSSGPKWQP